MKTKDKKENRKKPLLRIFKNFLPSLIWHISFCPKHTNPSLRQKQKSQIFPSTFWTLYILTALLSVDNSVAQNSPLQYESLYERTLKQVEQWMFQNSPDWQRVQELKMLRDNFPSLAPSYDYQINQIYQWYTPSKKSSNFSNSNAPIALNAQSIINQQNRQAMHMMGYKSAEELKAEQEKREFQQFYMSKWEQKRQEYYRLINEINADAMAIQVRQKTKPKLDPQFQLVDTNSVKFKVNTGKYFYAFNEIMKMLRGAKPLSIKEAVWLVESAFSNNKMTYQEYSKLIDEKVRLAKYVFQSEGLNNSNLAWNYAIQQLFSDTIIEYGANGKPIKTHYPLVYDFEDFLGDKDFKQLFVTKLLKTGTEQCHSMPLLYLIIAEELQAEAFLSFSPSHSFIMSKDNYGNLYNFETTNGRLTTRDWIMGSNYLKVEAIKSRIYLYALNKKEIITECLLDLASGYQQEFGYDGFVFNCADICIKYFPYSIGAKMIIANVGTAYCANEAYKLGNPPLEEFEKYPKLKGLFDEIVTLQTNIDITGFEEMPKDVYERWLRSVNKEKNKRNHDAISNNLIKQCGK